MAEGEELRPDLLKNTPSNIARLEDLIEHSKARQKYLAHTSSPSDDGDVRWYFRKIPLAPNASVPPTEIVSDYFRFCRRDSLPIEASFLQYGEILEDSDLSVGSTENNSKYESTSVGWYEPRDTIEEDLPLTFSDNVMVRSFSSKAKKVMQNYTASNF